jgi:hypothetical protein
MLLTATAIYSSEATATCAAISTTITAGTVVPLVYLYLHLLLVLLLLLLLLLLLRSAPTAAYCTAKHCMSAARSTSLCFASSSNICNSTMSNSSTEATAAWLLCSYVLQQEHAVALAAAVCLRAYTAQHSTLLCLVLCRAQSLRVVQNTCTHSHTQLCTAITWRLRAE